MSDSYGVNIDNNSAASSDENGFNIVTDDGNVTPSVGSPNLNRNPTNHNEATVDWNGNISHMKEFNFTIANCLLVPLPGNNKLFDYFSLLFDEILLENIVKYSNSYAQEILNCSPQRRKSRIND